MQDFAHRQLQTHRDGNCLFLMTNDQQIPLGRITHSVPQNCALTRKTNPASLDGTSLFEYINLKKRAIHLRRMTMACEWSD